MPGRGGRGPLQERVPRRLLAASRYVARGADARQRLLARRVGQSIRTTVELDRGKPPRTGHQRARVRRSIAAAACRSSSGRRFDASHRPQPARSMRSCSTTRSRTTTTRRSDSPPCACCSAPASARRSRRTAAADGRRFQRACSEPHARWPSETPRRCTPTPSQAGRWYSASRAACRRCARTHRRSCVARAVVAPRRSPLSACCSRSSWPR